MFKILTNLLRDKNIMASKGLSRSISFKNNYNYASQIIKKSHYLNNYAKCNVFYMESLKRNYSDNKSPMEKPSTSQKLKKAVTEYGTTVIVFHVGISLISLGTSYLLVSSGLDVSKVVTSFGIKDSNMVTNAGTFAVAYAFHKLLAPVRISITLTSVPFIVKYLRNKGILKKAL
ncbi:unnamed protein product [Brassicogethes aeneus]|uniref:DUF1279 domain-containing protein n=1 Tax=Brassicogethes aeneus TaxID=1431903 RepID=A0A9P0B8E2_BRAAE|nr:unnamed protein product [Brassicogethes aeneus]